MRLSRSQRWLRFILGGGLNTGVTYIFYLVLNTILNYQLAYLVSYLIGIFFAYWVNSKFVFRVQMSWEKFLSYPLIYIVQYVLSAFSLNIFVEYFHLSEMVAPLLVVTLLVPVTYLMTKYVLKKNSGSHDG